MYVLQEEIELKIRGGEALDGHPNGPQMVKTSHPEGVANTVWVSWTFTATHLVDNSPLGMRAAGKSPMIVRPTPEINIGM